MLETYLRSSYAMHGLQWILRANITHTLVVMRFIIRVLYFPCYPVSYNQSYETKTSSTFCLVHLILLDGSGRTRLV